MTVNLAGRNAIILLFCFILAVFAIFFAKVFLKKSEVVLVETKKDIAQGEKNKDCVFKVEERTVRGDSMAGLIENGQTVKILFGYYDCHSPERGDIIAYKYAANPEPLIKIIKASPGDSFKLEKTNGGYTMLINNEILKNSQNQPYILDEKGYRLLSLYEHDYKGIIPKNTYLILGNRVGGSLDSSRFGLIDKSDILGKIVIK